LENRIFLLRIHGFAPLGFSQWQDIPDKKSFMSKSACALLLHLGRGNKQRPLQELISTEVRIRPQRLSSMLYLGNTSAAHIPDLSIFHGHKMNTLTSRHHFGPRREFSGVAGLLEWEVLEVTLRPLGIQIPGVSTSTPHVLHSGLKVKEQHGA